MPQGQLIPPSVSAPARRTKRLAFGFGRRFVLMLAVGVLWAVPAFWQPRFLLVMAAWDLFALVAWAIDFWRLPKAEQLIVQRSWSGPPSLSNTVEVVIELNNHSRVGVDCRILDDVPESLRSEPPELAIRAVGQSWGTGTYIARPLTRGDVRLGPAYLRYQSGARFAERWARANCEQTIRVFPDIEEAKRNNIYLTRARQIKLEKPLFRQRGRGRAFNTFPYYHNTA